MGGRVYDAELGRFLSADPFVRDAADLQALNRYSYVENNPLSYTDPSGYFLKKLVKGIGRAIGKLLDGVGHAIKVALQKVGRVFGEIPGLAAAIGAAICGPAAAACWATFSKVMTGLNAAITLANGGTMGHVLQGAAIGLIAGRAGGGLTRVFGDSLGSQAGISMFLGGMTAKAQGGKFADGVKGAAIGFGVSYGVARIVEATSSGRFDSERGKLTYYDVDGSDPSGYLDSNGNPLLAMEWPSAPQGVVDFSAGLGDGIFFGFGDEIRAMAGIDGGINRSGGAYRAGGYTSLATLGGSRLTYAGVVRGYSAMASSGAAASAFRTRIGDLLRFGARRPYAPNLIQYKSDALLRAAAGRTNPYVNALGATHIGVNIYNIETQ